MKRKKSNAEVPSMAMGDIAFNLIVFFLVCASVQPDSGRKQTIPRSDKTEEQETADNIEVQLTRTSAMINGNVIRLSDFKPYLDRAFANKTRPEDRIVVVKSKTDTPYHHWIKVTELIEQAGGVITIQREEEQQVMLPAEG